MRTNFKAPLIVALALLAAACSNAEQAASGVEFTSTQGASSTSQIPGSAPDGGAAGASEHSAGDTDSEPADEGDDYSGDEPVTERVLNILYWQSATHANPYLSDGFKEIDAGAPTLEPLANYDPDGNIVANLAEEVPTLANGGINEDFTSITWRLRENLRWSNGSAMTADDVVFTWQYCTHPETECVNRVRFANVEEVKALDERTVQISFSAPTPFPYAPFVSTALSILSRKQFALCVGKAATSCEAENNAPLGTGPYRIVKFTPYEGAEYEPNHHYRGKRPYFDRIVLTGGGSAEDAAQSVLVDGTADYAWNLQIKPDVLREMSSAGKGSIQTSFASFVERLYLNQTNPDESLGDDRSEYKDGANPHPFLSFKPIRQAMSMAIDRNQLSEQLYGAAGKPACNLVTALERFVSTANDDCLTQDIAGANRLLDENGVIDTDDDGIREYKGVPLSVIYRTSTNEVRQETQRMIRGWWSQIGIETSIEHHAAGAFFGGERSDGGMSFVRFFGDVMMFTDVTGIDPQQALSEGLCKNIPTRENGWSERNYARICDAEFDAAFAQLDQTTDDARRVELIKQLNDIIVGNAYLIPLVRRGAISAHLNTLKGVRENSWDSSLWNIGEWRREEAATPPEEATPSPTDGRPPLSKAAG